MYFSGTGRFRKIEQGQTTQWPKEDDKQPSTKHYTENSGMKLG